MKKVLLLLMVTSLSYSLHAQTAKKEKAPPPPPPPPPPALTKAPAPPPPPPPPEEVKFTPPVIVNSLGYSLTVHRNNGNDMVYATKNGVTEKISLSKWNTNRSYYESKYGELPPPPPPPPAPRAPKAPKG